MTERTPIFSKFGQICSSRFLGICGYFWPRWLKPTYTTCWGISPIYSDDFNVKGVDQSEDHDSVFVKQLTELSVFFINSIIQCYAAGFL
jgi:hypothetical protein